MGAAASVDINISEHETVQAIHAKIAETPVEDTTLESLTWPVDTFTVTGAPGDEGWTVTYDATQEQLDGALAKYTEGGLDSDASSALLKSLLEKEVALVTGFPEGVTVEQGPVLKGIFAPAPVEEAPVEEAPKEEAPVEEAPKEEAPVEEAPKEEAPVEEAPKEEAPVEEAPKEEAPAPVEEAPAPVEEAPAPVEEAPKTVDAPSEEAPAPTEAA